jgi:flagellar motor switch protein FliG
MTGLRKAAILCLSLGEEAAATLLTHLEEEEVHRLSREIALLPKVKPETTDSVAEEFHQLMVAKNYVQTGGIDYAKRLLIKSFGAETAKRLMDKILHALEGPASFEALEKTDPLQISKLFQSEQPQTVAVVLAHMDASTASAVLRHLPQAVRGEIVLRLASLQNVSQDVVKRTAGVLTQKLSSVNTGVNRTNLGGVRAVADICNRLDRDTMRVLLEQIEEHNPPLALEIRNLMVTFEDILLVDDLGVREILTRVDKKVLTLALKGTMSELQERFFSNMSSRAVDMMKEEIDFMGQVKMK